MVETVLVVEFVVMEDEWEVSWVAQVDECKGPELPEVELVAQEDACKVPVLLEVELVVTEVSMVVMEVGLEAE